MGYQWKLSDNTVTDADQTVTFTIAPRDISETVTLSAAGTFNTLDELKSAIRVSPKGELNPVSGTDYTLSYSTISDSRVTATLTGKGNYTGTVSASFTMGDQGGGSSGGGSSGGGSSGGGNDQDDGDGNDDGNNEGENEGGNGTQYDSSIFAGGASIKEAEEVLLSLTSDKDPGGTSFTPIRALSTKQTKTAVKLGWTKTKGAVRYNILRSKER